MTPRDWREKYSHLSFTDAMNQSAVDEKRVGGKEGEIFSCEDCKFETISEALFEIHRFNYHGKQHNK